MMKCKNTKERGQDLTPPHFPQRDRIQRLTARLCSYRATSPPFGSPYCVPGRSSRTPSPPCISSDPRNTQNSFRAFVFGRLNPCKPASRTNCPNGTGRRHVISCSWCSIILPRPRDASRGLPRSVSTPCVPTRLRWIGQLRMVSSLTPSFVVTSSRRLRVFLELQRLLSAALSGSDRRAPLHPPPRLAQIRFTRIA